MNFNHDTGSIDTILSIDTTIAPPLGGTTGVLNIIGTGGIQLPVGTTAQQPANSAGMIRYNSQTGGLEFNNGSTWSGAGGSVTSVAVSGSTGLSVTGSPITGSGTITLTLGTELQGLSGLAATGMIARTAAGTYSARTIAGTASNIIVTNGDGVAGAPTINLATAGSAVSNLFQKITTDAYGRVTATSSVSSTDITTALGYTPINKAGDTAVGSLTLSSAANITMSGGGTVTGLPTAPSGSTDAASKAYVDSVAQGLTPKQVVRAATTTAGTLASSFANGSVIDGVTLATGDRILIKNQAAPAENGIYTVNASGAPTRASDMNVWTEVINAYVFVSVGTTMADTGWVCTSDAGGTLGTTAINWVQFGGAGTYTAGTGLTLTGTTFSITAGIATNLGGTGLTSIGTSNQILGVNTGATGLEYKTVSAGTGVSVTPAAGSLTIANTGVTSAVAGTGIGVSGATGAVTITNNGVTSLAGTTNQVSASASTGAVTLSLPSTVVAPGSVQITSGLYQSTSATVSAAGSTQGTATALTSSYNVVTTAAAGTGVALPTPTVAGWAVTVVNRGANAITVYPQSGASIDGASANTGFSLPVNDSVTVQASSTSAWFTTSPVDVQGTGISITSGPGTMTIANTGVTSITGTANQITASASTGAVTLSLPSSISATNLTLSGLTANSFLYSGTSGALTTTTAPTNGQLLIGSTGAAPVAAALTQGTGITITNGAGSISIANAGVTSFTQTVPSIMSISGASAATGAVSSAITLATQTANVVFAGPTSSTAAPTFRALVYGDLPIKLYTENPSTPTTPLAAGTNAVAIGSGSSAPATGAYAVGAGSSAGIYGQKAYANGDFATAGDAQAGLYVLRNVTTTATATELFLDGAAGTQRIVVGNNSVWTFDILVAARRTDATGGGAGYRFTGVLRKDTTAGSLTFVGTPSKSIIGETNTAWDVALTADTTNGSIKLSVTGEAAKTIRWVATVQTSEVTN